MAEPGTFTGIQRRRTTRRSVRIADVVSRFVIMIGGIGTIVAVAAVGVFLIAVAAPLFLPAKTHLIDSASRASEADPDAPVALAVDEYQTLIYSVSPAGVMTVRNVADGAILSRDELFSGRTPTSWSFSTFNDTAVVGFDDGSIQAFRLGFKTEFVSEGNVPEAMYQLSIGDTAPFENGVVELTPLGQFRVQRPYFETLGEPQVIAPGPVSLLAHSFSDDQFNIVALNADRDRSMLSYVVAEESENMFTGDRTFELTEAVALPFEQPAEPPRFLLVSGPGDNVYVLWADGTAQRIYTGALNEAYLAEQVDMIESDEADLTAANLLLGGATLIIGDSNGNIRGWFIAPAQGDEAPPDRYRLIAAKELDPASTSPVQTIAPATRRRLFVAGHIDGTIAMYYMTNEARIARFRTPGGAATLKVSISPKEDALLAATSDQVLRWALDPRYPEASFGSLFAPIWYERYAEPEFIWQSSSGTDDFEPKLGMAPLIFGTIKATFYSMLFGAPIALLAAIYTSEFLDPKWRTWIKPVIELMASLPSVVLGFLAALVVAPYIENVVPSTIAAFLTIPLSFLFGGFLWQLIPRRFTARFAPRRVVVIAPFLALGLALATIVGPTLEAWLFDGQFKGWLNALHADADAGGALGGWVIVLTPLCGLMVAIATSLWINPRIRRFGERFDRRWTGLIDLAKFGVGIGLTAGLVLVVGLLLSSLGLDVRKPLPNIGAFMDTYDQRNALVVGFIMGFAIIPIIYTIADDALSTVPGHLRSASLGAGATPWQTAVRIVVPTAMSGLFSALMIGLGRAVGETMIVLMAAGNTPVMNMNIFEGFRTLSANIAVELPEAPVGDTHYRVLFFAALVLFAMTFVVNTIAEAVRLRFRKRAYQL